MEISFKADCKSKVLKQSVQMIMVVGAVFDMSKMGKCSIKA